MHENLKMRVDLSLKDNEPKVKDWQPIVAKLDYGTFHMIYLKFHSYSPPIDDDINEHIYEVSFKIQNYQGAVTMGLVPNQTNNATENQIKTEKFHYQFPIFIEPFSCNEFLPKTELKFNRDICGCNIVLDVDVKVLPPPRLLFNSSDLNNSPYVDPEKFMRDGDSFFKISYRNIEEQVPNKDRKSHSLGGLGKGELPCYSHRIQII